jgi:DeoR/GlpR family transcriptional regulator of sugar metabolism
MLDQYRENEIIKLIKAKGTVRVSELSKLLDVSEATVRRDLDKLDGKSQIQRIHGGAILIEKSDPEPPVILRKTLMSDEKERIGKAAANLINEHETIFLGSGTTAEAVARNLVGHKNITVITNALTVINILVQENGISLIATGGLFRDSELSFIGHITEQSLKELRPQKVIMGIRAINLTAGLTNDYLPEVSTDRVIIQSAPEVYIVADHTKFEKVSTAFVAPVTSVNKIITDSGVPESIISHFHENNIEVLVV